MKRLIKHIDHWRGSIAARLLVKVFAIYIIITLVVTLVHMYAEFKATKLEVNRDLVVFQGSFEPGVSLAIWNQDDEALQRELLAIHAVPQIVGAKLLDDEGRFVIGIGHIRDASGAITYFRPEPLARLREGMGSPIGMFQDERAIYYRDDGVEYKVGTLTIYSSGDFVFSRVVSEYTFILINALIKTLALWLIVLWQSKPVISKPIEEFSKKMGDRNLDNISDLKLELNTDGVHELEMLERSFNQMAGNLGQEIAARKQVEKELEENETRLKYALNVSNEGFWDWHIDTEQVYYNANFFNMLGYHSADIVHDHDAWFDLVHPDDKTECQSLISKCIAGKLPSFKLEYRLETCGGDYLWIMAQGKIVEHDSSGKPVRFVGTHADISSLKETEERLRHLASYDGLTKLPNRHMFVEHLHRAILEAKRDVCRHALLFLDLDRFKIINDSLGHTIGDQLLVDVASRIKAAIRNVDFVARLGGDEFTVLLKYIEQPFQAAEAAERIIDALSKPFNLSGHQVVTSPSIGIVLYPDDDVTPEDLIKKADLAMYQAKQEGGGGYHFFNEEMTQQANVRLETETALRKAIEKQDEIVVHYQPQVSLETGNINGLEALVRWQKDGRLVPPNDFIPMAEETGLIVPLGDIIMRTVFQDMKRWLQYNKLSHRVAINISAVQFSQWDFIKKVDELLEETGVATQYIEFELTEASVMKNVDYALSAMAQLKERGISLALDDFGTGHSSLSYLKKFPIDILKIDKSFIDDMELADVNKRIVKSIIELSHHLNLKVVAEGVESKSQLDMLASIGCDSMQGYFYSKPLHYEVVTKLLMAKRSLYGAESA